MQKVINAREGYFPQNQFFKKLRKTRKTNVEMDKGIHGKRKTFSTK